MSGAMFIKSGVRLARPEDLETLKELQVQCFGDSPEGAAAFLHLRYEPGTCYVWEEKGRILAMAHALPVTLRLKEKTVAAAYFYAVATHPQARGQGISTHLLEDAWQHLQQKGVEAALLVPASQQLFDFYGKRGYQALFPILEGSGDDLPCVRLPLPALREISAEKYLTLRQRCLQGSVYADWGLRHISYQQQLAQSSGGGLFVVDYLGESVGCAAVELWEGAAQVKELLAPQPILGVAVAAIKARLSPSSLWLRLWAKEDRMPALAQSLNLRPFAMARASDPKLMLAMQDGYFNLPLD